MSQKVLYTRGKTYVDTILSARNRSLYGGGSLYQLRKRYPAGEVMPFDDAIALITEVEWQTLCNDPVPCSYDYYLEMLGVLPPEQFRSYRGGSYFNMVEHYTGDIATIFFRKGEECFTCTNRIGSKKELFDKIKWNQDK